MVSFWEGVRGSRRGVGRGGSGEPRRREGEQHVRQLAAQDEGAERSRRAGPERDALHPVAGGDIAVGQRPSRPMIGKPSGVIGRIPARGVIGVAGGVQSRK